MTMRLYLELRLPGPPAAMRSVTGWWLSFRAEMPVCSSSHQQTRLKTLAPPCVRYSSGMPAERTPITGCCRLRKQADTKQGSKTILMNSLTTPLGHAEKSHLKPPQSWEQEGSHSPVGVCIELLEGKKSLTQNLGRS